MSTARSGRRPGETTTRDAILAAAKRQFGEHGFDRTSVRSVAAEAGVDPALVRHFFGSKQQLFTRAVELPYALWQEIPRLLAGDRADAGRRVAEFIVGALETEDGRARLTGIVRAAASEPEAARILRDVISGELVAPVVEALGVEDAAFRATLAGSQVVGLVMARYVVALEPLASLPPERVVAAIAPTLQRYLVEPL